MTSSSGSSPRAIFLAAPNYKGAGGSFIVSLLQLQVALASRQTLLLPWLIENESNIDRARAKACAAFLRSKASHMLMCDSDMGFNATDMLAMIDADKPVIGAVMCAKQLDFDIIVAAARAHPELSTRHCVAAGTTFLFAGPAAEDFTDLRQPQRIERIGTGCMLIRRDVIEQLSADYKDALGTSHEDVEFVDLFRKTIDKKTGKQIGTDYSFCDRVRAHGFTVWLAPWASTTHRGEYTFRASLLDMCE